MKLLLKILVFILSAHSAIGQIYLKPNNSYGIISNRNRPDSTQWIPTGCGTPTGIASLRSSNQFMGAIYADTCNKRFFLFNPTDTTWIGIYPIQISDSSFKFGRDTIVLRGGGGSGSVKGASEGLSVENDTTKLGVPYEEESDASQITGVRKILYGPAGSLYLLKPSLPNLATVIQPGYFAMAGDNAGGQDGRFFIDDATGSTLALRNKGTYSEITHGSARIGLNNSGQVNVGSASGMDGAAKLTVEGKVQIKDGSQGAGKAIISDENGVGTWGIPAAIPDSGFSIATTDPVSTMGVNGNYFWNRFKGQLWRKASGTWSTVNYLAGDTIYPRLSTAYYGPLVKLTTAWDTAAMIYNTGGIARNINHSGNALLPYKDDPVYVRGWNVNAEGGSIQQWKARMLWHDESHYDTKSVGLPYFESHVSVGYPTGSAAAAFAPGSGERIESLNVGQTNYDIYKFHTMNRFWYQTRLVSGGPLVQYFGADATNGFGGLKRITIDSIETGGSNFFQLDGKNVGQKIFSFGRPRYLWTANAGLYDSTTFQAVGSQFVINSTNVKLNGSTWTVGDYATTSGTYMDNQGQFYGNLGGGQNLRLWGYGNEMQIAINKSGSRVAMLDLRGLNQHFDTYWNLNTAGGEPGNGVNFNIERTYGGATTNDGIIGENGWTFNLNSASTLKTVFNSNTDASGNYLADLVYSTRNTGASTQTEKLRVTNDGELRIGATTDRGAFTLQNTGGFHNTGSISLNGLNLGTNAMNVLLHGDDSLVRKISASSLLASAPNFFNTNLTATGNRSHSLGSSYARLGFTAGPAGDGYIGFNDPGRRGITISGYTEDDPLAGIFFIDPSVPSMIPSITNSFGTLYINSADGGTGFSTDGTMFTQSAGNNRSINISDQSILVSDEIGSIGFSYFANYRTAGITEMGDRWIPDHGSVKQSIADSLTALRSSIGIGSSGTYTPTVSSQTNASVSIDQARYTISGNICTVYIVGTLTNTSIAAVSFKVTLPPAAPTNLGNYYDLSGHGGWNANVLKVLGDAANDLAEISFAASTITAANITFSYSYMIQ